MGRVWRGLVVRGLVAGLVVVMTLAASAQDEVAFARAKHLRRGVNLSMWYAQDHDLYNATGGAEKLATYTTPADFKLVRKLGFDHVRLSIDPVPLMADKQTGALDPVALARLDATVKEITSLGLVVVLDTHPEESWKKEVTTTDEGAALFFRYWKNFAQHFAGSDPKKVYFEVLNEPEGVNPYRWEGEQARLVAILREETPRHTIIATGEGWGGIDGLLEMEPVRDDDVIYSFHDYEPMEFTHQGAGWAMKTLTPLRNVPYPSTPEKVSPLLQGIADDAARAALASYGQQQWTVATMEKRIGLAMAWAKQRHVPLWCGEFGVYRAYAPAPDRARWIADMRKTLEQDGIGWDMWDYQASFGLVTKKDGVTTVDPTLVEALGLKEVR